MGKIFNALEKYRSERKDLASHSEPLLPQDLEALMQFNRRTGRLNLTSRALVKDPETVRRLVAHQLIFEDGRITAEGERKVEELILLRREALAGPMEPPVDRNFEAAPGATLEVIHAEPVIGEEAPAGPQPAIGRSSGDRSSTEEPPDKRMDSEAQTTAAAPLEAPLLEKVADRSAKSPARQPAPAAQTRKSQAGRGAAAESPPPRPSVMKALRRSSEAPPAGPPAGGAQATAPAPAAAASDAPKKPPAPAARQKIDPNMVTLLTPQSFESEQFKILRTNLLYPVEGKPPRSVLVTSVNPGDGKSFIAANLAVSVALNINRYVLLMDCDLRKPSIHRQFGLGDLPGLSEYLTQNAPLPSLLVQTKVERLSILPGGTPPPNPSELLSSDRMGALIEEVTNRYKDRLIIIDSPPPTMTAETGVLARMAEGIVLVARYSSTNREELKRLLEHLGKEKIVGCILNYFDFRSVGLQGYRYYRKYGKYRYH